jgi:hypothetical protein
MTTTDLLGGLRTFFSSATQIAEKVQWILENNYKRIYEARLGKVNMNDCMRFGSNSVRSASSKASSTSTHK